MVPMFDMMHELFGICWPEGLVIYDHDKALWILENEAVVETSHKFTEKIILPPAERERFYKIWDEYVGKLSQIESEIDKISLSHLNDNDLAIFFKRWSQAYLNYWAIGMTAELINYSLEDKLKKSLRAYFEDERDLNKAFATLSTPTQMSFYKEEEADLVKIVLLDASEKAKALKKHSENYFWIYNNYFDTQILDEIYFANQIKHKTRDDAEKFLTEIRDYKNKALEGKDVYKKKLNLSGKELGIVNLLNESIIFQDVRKKYNLKAAHYLEEFLRDFSARRDIEARDLKWLLPKEMERFADGEDLREAIEKRKHLATVQIALGSLQIDVQNTASKISSQFDVLEFEESTNIQGTVASTSNKRYFRGIAKIILSPREGNKLKAGEILVTTMTTPDFVTCMKRAGAIITDIGGVTCHAAVVSREFGIPCIVGTEYATKIIKDGDILELHNLRGTVKIVR